MTGYINRLRGVFALLVVLGHATAFAAQNSTSDIGLDWLIRPIAPYMGGFAWVVGFIVLSGFCIATSCAKDRNLTPQGYVALRFSRLFPMLWVCLAVTVAVETVMLNSTARPNIWTTGIDQSSLSSTALGLGAYQSSYGSISPSYTLSFELVFYLLWAIAWFGSGKRPGRALTIGAAVGVVLAVAIWNSPTLAAIPYAWLTVILYSCWLIGAGLALNFDRLTQLRSLPWLSHVRWLPVAVVLYVGHRNGMPRLIATKASWIFYPTLAAAFAFLVLAWSPRGESNHWYDRMLGNLSYPLYLVHGPMVAFTTYLIVAGNGHLTFSVFLTVIVCSAVFAAAILEICVERPVMSLRRYARTHQVGRLSFRIHQSAAAG